MPDMTISYPNILLDALEIGVMILDDSFTICYWNKWLELNTGIRANDCIGKTLDEFYPDIDYRVFSRKIRTTLRLDSPTFYDATIQSRFIQIPRTKITTSLLTTMQLQVTISPYIIENSMVMVSIYDISELHELKLTLQDKMAKIAHLNHQLEREKQIIDTNLLIVQIDTECCIVEVTSAFESFFGCLGEEVAGKPLAQVLGEEVDDINPRKIREAIGQKSRWSGEVRARNKNDTTIWLDVVVTPFASVAGERQHYSVILNDITDKKRIETLSITDSLTKLYNRHKFNEVFGKMLLRRHWNDENTFALIIVDVDHFKRINDTYGHQEGDHVLVGVAGVLSHTIRTGDILARWGGEEFVCLLPDVNLEKAIFVAEKLRNSIEEQPFPEVGKVTASFGVSLFKNGDGAESLLHRADSALYTAKSKGRNRVEWA